MNFRDANTNKDIHRAIPVFDRSAEEFSETYTTRTRARTEEELIMDEVTELVGLCKCISKYKVYHVGDSKYRVICFHFSKLLF